LLETGFTTWFSSAMTSIINLIPGRQSRRDEGLASRLNWLRAGVLGANDGIVSVAAIVVGVAGATTNNAPILAAGLAGLVGGAISMALGEYVSVSSQRDLQRALIAKEQLALQDAPDLELAHLAKLYEQKGLTTSTAHQVAVELTAHDALGAHLEAKLHIEEDDVASPWHAALASALSFTVGGLLPLLAILLIGMSVRVPATFVVVLIALAITGAAGAKIGGSPVGRATVRVVVGGALALAVTYGIGHLLGATGIV
jgi:VIT1/CCC1 family predicted Fe2+/Mn2+ transporter